MKAAADMDLSRLLSRKMHPFASPLRVIPPVLISAALIFLWWITGQAFGLAGLILALSISLTTLLVRLIQAQARQLRQVNHFIQDLINAIPEPVYIKDSQARFIWVNEAFAKERRCPAASLIGASSYDLSPNAAFSAILLQEDSTVLAGGSIFKEQHTTYPGTQDECYRLVSKRLCRTASQQALIIGVHFDITRMRQAETALQQALAREVSQTQRIQTYTQRLIDVIPQPVYVKDADSRYIMVNTAFCTYRRAERAALIGKSPAELSNDSLHIQKVIAEDQQVMAGVIVTKEECRKHPVTNEDCFRFISKGTCEDAQGEPVIVGANFDITAWRTAELRWKQASAAKSLFLATMSHEIRTPLSGVIGMIQLALQTQDLPRQAQDYLKTGLDNAELLLEIISDILDFSKIEAGQLQLEHASFDLHATIRNTIESFQSRADAKNITLAIDIAEGVPCKVCGDSTRIRQILTNLLGNALKFTAAGKIQVLLDTEPCHTTPGRSGVRCQVIDTGIGIAPEVIPGLFTIFQQGDQSTTRRFGGTGLGLAICRQLVNAMGGEISATSTLGQGACFTFNILLDIATPPSSAPEVPGLVPHAHILRILCAEDVRVNQLIIEAQLHQMGHKVKMVGNGKEAIHALAQDDYDLVLMDGRMPEMDGPEATRLIRQGGLDGVKVRNPMIRIVALTANASSEDRELALEAGMDDYLTKPVREAQLHAVLNDTVSSLDTPKAY
jgi:CheY-like chemotaxis protein/PAS domain-containing protein